MIGPQKLTVYTGDFVEIIDAFSINNHLYKDDAQLQKHLHVKAIQETPLQLEHCFNDVREWCSTRRLQLNPDKTRGHMVWIEGQPQ